MNNLHSVAAMTGMKAPTGSKVRRGGGRHKGAPSKPSSPQGHLDNLTSAMKSGNHAQAKVHALTLANALHKLTGGKASGSTGPSNPSSPQTLGLSSGSQAMPDPTDGY